MMRLVNDPEEYVRDGETVYSEVEAQSVSGWDPSSGGKIYCTDKRVVYASKKRYVDISLSNVSSIEFVPWYLFNKKFLTGLGLALFGLGLIALGFVLSEIPDPLALVFGGLIVFVGVIIIIEDLWYRNETLTLRTPAKSYKYSGKDLGEVPHAIRGSE